MKIFIGYDDREPVAYHVLAHSIKRHTKEKVDIYPLKHRELREKGLFMRPWRIDAYKGIYYDAIDDRPFSTQFSHTRFVVPALTAYDGWALFMDCDMLFTDDIAKLWQMREDKYAVMCVKHNHRSKTDIKMDNMPQLNYKRKNWSSFMLMNCSHEKNKALTPELVSTKPGNWLHGLEWLDGEDIGHLPYNYNWIDGVSPVNKKKPSVVHYTEGGPWFENCKNVKYADLWDAEYQRWQRDSSFDTPCTLPVWRGE